LRSVQAHADAVFQAIILGTLDSFNIHSLRRRNRTFPTAINLIADGIVALIIAIPVLNSWRVLDLDGMRFPCQDRYWDPEPIWDHECLRWALPTVIVGWILQIAALSLG
jgi:hypothetical protein